MLPVVNEGDVFARRDNASGRADDLLDELGVVRGVGSGGAAAGVVIVSASSGRGVIVSRVVQRDSGRVS